MKELNKQFAPYEQSLQLVEIGFDEECLAFYDKNGMVFFNSRRDGSGFYETIKNGEIPPNWTCAVLWQQAFDWFREEKDLYADIYRTGNLFSANIEDMLMGNSLCEVCKEINYEEARQACLEKLIELCGK